MLQPHTQHNQREGSNRMVANVESERTLNVLDSFGNIISISNRMTEQRQQTTRECNATKQMI